MWQFKHIKKNKRNFLVGDCNDRASRWKVNVALMFNGFNLNFFF